MKDSIDEALNNLIGGKKADYSVDDVDLARKRQKKYGGTLMDNLNAIKAEKSGKSAMPTLDLSGLSSNMSGATSDLEKISASMEATNADIMATLQRMNANLEKDFGAASQPAMLEQSATEQAEQSLQQMEQQQLTDNAEILENFVGVGDVVKAKVYGQDDFIKKLVISFKRPYVTERDSNDALNSIYVTGPSCTGKHYALTTLVEELGKRRVLVSNEIVKMDLSLYPTAAEEKLFLQDLYAALQSNSSVILFENIDACHVSMLTRLGELVTTGECKLSERYVMQKGHLVNVANALAQNTVGSFEASGKYLIFIGTKPLDKLAGIMGAPFVNALGDVCVANDLDEETYKKISTEQECQLIDKCKKQLMLDVVVEDSYREYVLTQTSKNRALSGILRAYADTMKALAELVLERDEIPENKATLIAENGSAIIKIAEEKVPMQSLLPSGYTGALDEVKADMDAIVGLKKVKDYILSLEEYFEVQKMRRESGLKAGEVNKHMIFTGNPGTGKTTIARIVSKYLKAIGVLSGGQLVEVSRGDLVGRFVGHTAPLVNQVVKSAIGGVLFIDEAYSLYRGEDDSFGLEAIDTLVKAIEDNRDDLVVILAGYSYEMEGFLEANSGLKSRFPNIIDFPDYTGEELIAIAKLTAKSKGYVIDEAVIEPLQKFFEEVQATNAREAGNGRLVRNKIEAAILNQSRRLIVEKDADMSLLTEMDFDYEFKA